MHWLLYLRLVLLTAGTLLPFFWMVVILGHRRQRNFERVFFFLCLALTCFFGSSLLALNADLYYSAPPQGLMRFAWTSLCFGLWLIPPLVLHLHVEYASIRELPLPLIQKTAWLTCAWAPTILLIPYLLRALRSDPPFAFPIPSQRLGIPFQLWLVFALGLGVYWQWRFENSAPDLVQRIFHKKLKWNLGVLTGWLFFIFVFWIFYPGEAASSLLVAMLFALVPLAGLITEVQRFNFLQIGRQRNLIYAVFLVFLALLYLSFIRRASLLLTPFLPPEATAALLLFLPVVFLEPLQRSMKRLLRQTAQTEVDRAQKLMGPINDVARLGNQRKLEKFNESWIAEQLQLAEVKLVLDGAIAVEADFPKGGSANTFEIKRGGKRLGTLMVRAHGAMISGETYAALEFLSEQLPSAFDLCRLIEEKLQLERELAERERLALVGQMAASISHNLKNPLGSIKTILQVQMESPELPSAMKQEMQMVLDEIRRLSEKLNQLLQFSRPGLRSSGAHDCCDVSRVAESVAAVLRHEAEQRGIVLEVKIERPPRDVAASAEVANDILSNLLLNALEAAPEGGHVHLSLTMTDGGCRISVEDDGAGVPVALQGKILQPFFTTKARGTGLGLAIVARRVEEVSGKLLIQSPVRDEQGSRFSVTLPLVTKEAQP